MNVPMIGEVNMSFTAVPKPTKGSKPKKLDKPSRTQSTLPKEPMYLDRDEFDL